MLWLAAVVEGTLAAFVGQVVQIPALSAAGAAQLATDVGYLANVIAALGPTPDGILGELEGMLLMPAADLMAAAASENCEPLRRRVAQQRQE